MYTVKKYCHYCGSLVHGRADKKFCNDGCRSSYNNGRKEVYGDVVRVTNSLLSRNRRILSKVLEEGVETIKFPKDRMSLMGFNFNYHSHHLPDSMGRNYWFCYDYGYMDMGNGWITIIKDIGENYLKKLG